MLFEDLPQGVVFIIPSPLFDSDAFIKKQEGDGVRNAQRVFSTRRPEWISVRGGTKVKAINEFNIEVLFVHKFGRKCVLRESEAHNFLLNEEGLKVIPSGKIKLFGKEHSDEGCSKRKEEERRCRESACNIEGAGALQKG